MCILCENESYDRFLIFVFCQNVQQIAAQREKELRESSLSLKKEEDLALVGKHPDLSKYLEKADNLVENMEVCAPASSETTNIPDDIEHIGKLPKKRERSAEDFDMRPSKNIDVSKVHTIRAPSKPPLLEEIEGLEVEPPVKPALKPEKRKQGIGLLEMIKQTQETRSSSTDSQLDSSKITAFSTEHYGPVSTGFIPVIAQDGSIEFNIVDDCFKMSLKCLCYTMERRTQGILSREIKLVGKLSLASLREFISNCQSSKRRVIAPISVISRYASDESYRNFNSDLSAASKVVAVYHDKRSDGDEVNFYLLPIEYKNQLTGFGGDFVFRFPNKSLIVGYEELFVGFLVSRKPGPVEYLKCEVHVELGDDGSILNPNPFEAKKRKLVEEQLCARVQTESSTDSASYNEKVVDKIDLIGDEINSLEAIKKCANFCALYPNGLQQLRDADNAREKMPFIFEGNPQYIEFNETLLALRENSDENSVEDPVTVELEEFDVPKQQAPNKSVGIKTSGRLLPRKNSSK